MQAARTLPTIFFPCIIIARAHGPYPAVSTSRKYPNDVMLNVMYYDVMLNVMYYVMSTLCISDS